MHTAGFDFGTSTTLVATRDSGGVAQVHPIGAVTTWLPSVVGLDGGSLVAGDDAERLPRRVAVRSIKRAITRGESYVTLPSGEEIDVDEAIGALLSVAVRNAHAAGVALDDADVVQLGCPAMWQGPERRRLLTIAEDNGLKVPMSALIDEPISAGIAWIEERRRSGMLPDSKVLVFDPGGGTLDVALLKVLERDGQPEISVLSAEGIDEAGDELDRSIARDLRSTTRGLQDDPVSEALLLDRAREIKETLSTDVSDRRALDPQSPIVLEYDRDRLERAFEAQCKRALGLIESVVRAGKIREQQSLPLSAIRSMTWEKASDGIDYVVLVGGMSRVPMLLARIRELFPLASVATVPDPQYAIVRGLAFAERYQRLNLHRPGFDFWVTYHDRHKQPVGESVRVYEAFTPLYERSDLFSCEGFLGAARDVPSRFDAATALLHCRTVDGEDLRLELNGETVRGIPAPLDGRHPARFKLYANGDIVFGVGGTTKLRVKSWPTLRGSHHDWAMELEIDDRAANAPTIDEWRFLH